MEATWSGVTIEFQRVDMTDREEIFYGVDQLRGMHSRVDVLVNNDGGSLHTAFHLQEQIDEDWGRVMNVNVSACIRVTQTVTPHMKKLVTAGS